MKREKVAATEGWQRKHDDMYYCLKRIVFFPFVHYTKDSSLICQFFAEVHNGKKCSNRNTTV